VQMMFGIHLRGLRDAHAIVKCSGKEDTMEWIVERWPSWDKVSRVETLWDPRVFSLIQSMLCFNPNHRPSCSQCLQHDCFKDSDWHGASFTA